MSDGSSYLQQPMFHVMMFCIYCSVGSADCRIGGKCIFGTTNQPKNSSIFNFPARAAHWQYLYFALTGVGDRACGASCSHLLPPPLLQHSDASDERWAGARVLCSLSARSLDWAGMPHVEWGDYLTRGLNNVKYPYKSSFWLLGRRARQYIDRVEEINVVTKPQGTKGKHSNRAFGSYHTPNYCPNALLNISHDDDDISEENYNDRLVNNDHYDRQG